MLDYYNHNRKDLNAQQTTKQNRQRMFRGIKRVFFDRRIAIATLFIVAGISIAFSKRYAIFFWMLDIQMPTYINDLNKVGANLFAVIPSFLVLDLWFYIIGTPYGCSQINKGLLRAGFVNSIGEPPTLIRFEKDKKNTQIRILEFEMSGIPLSMWIDAQTSIESALNIHILKIYLGKDNQHVIVECVNGKNLLSKKIYWRDDMLCDEPGFGIVLGQGYAKPITIFLDVTPHMLIAGASGSGKSFLTRCILMQCIKKGARVFIVDFKKVDFSAAIWAQKCERIYTQEHLEKALSEIVGELYNRQDLFSNLCCANIEEYNRTSAPPLQHYVVGIDELAEVLDKTGLNKAEKEKIEKIEGMLSIIARLGRAFGINLILSTQRADALLLNGQIRSNISTHICGRADSNLSQLILNSNAACDLIDINSQGRFITNSGEIFQGYLFDETNALSNEEG